MRKQEPKQENQSESLRQLALQRLLEEAQVKTPTFISLYRPKVWHPQLGSTAFIPYQYQLDYFEALDSGKNAVVLKARQIGFSIATAVYLLRRMLVPNTHILVVSISEEKSKDFLEKTRQIKNSCYPYYPLREKHDSVLLLQFNNGSKIQASSSSSNAGRGGSYSVIVLDEFEAMPDVEAMYQSLRPTISRGGQQILISTPKNEGSLFYTLYMNAQDDEKYSTFEVPWNECPVYGDEWYADNRKGYTTAQWEMEFECRWGRDDALLFRYEDIKHCQELYSFYYPDGLKNEKEDYVIGADFAGEGNDKTVFVALNTAKSPCVVADIKVIDNASAPKLQSELEDFAEDYSATPLVDKTGMGWAIAGNLKCPHSGVVFTSGNQVTKSIKTRDWHIPRDKLMQNLAKGIEQKDIAIPPKYVELFKSLYGARQNKKKSVNADYLDAFALAYWSASQIKHKPRKIAIKPYGL